MLYSLKIVLADGSSGQEILSIYRNLVARVDVVYLIIRDQVGLDPMSPKSVPVNYCAWHSLEPLQRLQRHKGGGGLTTPFKTST